MSDFNLLQNLWMDTVYSNVRYKLKGYVLEFKVLLRWESILDEYVKVVALKLFQ